MSLESSSDDSVLVVVFGYGDMNECRFKALLLHGHGGNLIALFFTSVINKFSFMINFFFFSFFFLACSK